MKTLLIVFLFAITSCTFSGSFLDIANCLFKNKKLKDNLPKFVQDFKSGDFINIIKNGISIFSDVKLEVEQCLQEPSLSLSYLECLERQNSCFSSCKGLSIQCSALCSSYNCLLYKPNFKW